MEIFYINWWSFLRTDQHWASMLQWDVRGLLGIMANVAICKCVTSDLMGWRSWSSYVLFNGYKHIFFFYSKQHILNGKWSKSTNKTITKQNKCLWTDWIQCLQITLKSYTYQGCSYLMRNTVKSNIAKFNYKKMHVLLYHRGPGSKQMIQLIFGIRIDSIWECIWICLWLILRYLHKNTFVSAPYMLVVCFPIIWVINQI